MLDATNEALVSASEDRNGTALPEQTREASSGAATLEEPINDHATSADTTHALLASGSQTPDAAAQCELPTILAGLKVHPLANQLPFPLMKGREFDQLVESIADLGVQMPVTLHEGMLLEGRNRARAVEVLRGRGVNVDLPTEPWRPTRGEAPLEFVLLANARRRHMTNDQIAVLMASRALAEIRTACAARQKASRFRKEAAGDNHDAAALNSVPPHGPASEVGMGGRLSRVEKFQQSAVGRLSTLAGVSRHTAEQAVGLVDDVAAGLVPQEDLDGVLDGTIPLRKVSRRKRARPLTTVKPAAELVNAEEFEPFEERDVSEAEVRDRWEKFKQPFAVADHGELRRIVASIVAEEQLLFDC